MSVKLSDWAINRLIILIDSDKFINNICDAIEEPLKSMSRIEAQPPSKFHKLIKKKRLKSKYSLLGEAQHDTRKEYRPHTKTMARTI